jgi:alpha-tubulin suppressor-like RCC1 family protein
MTCGLATDHRTWCWGGVDPIWPQGELVPRLVDSTLAFTDIGVGFGELCGLTGAGQIYCGAFAPDNPPHLPWTIALQPAFDDTSHSFVSMAVTDFRTCGLTAGGAVYCNGGFSTGDSYKWELAQPEDGGRAFTSLSGSPYHTCGLVADGTAYCWGQNDGDTFEPYTGGELGTGHGSTSVPTPVAGGYRFTALSAGFGHTCGITTGGQSYCWGTNRNGELGTADAPSRTNEADYPIFDTPALVAGELTFRDIYTGPGHSCALAGTDTWCWGTNANGELQQSPPAEYRVRFAAFLRSEAIRAARMAAARR